MEIPPVVLTHNYQRGQSCVLDPVLTLSPYGLSLVKGLEEVMELWVVRELWQILDNTQPFLQRPELVIPSWIDSESSPEERRTALEEIFRSLKEWERRRRETDLRGLNLFWLGDSLRESFLPTDRNVEVFWRWESLGRSLEERIDQSKTAGNILNLAFRDAVALVASLESAFILTRQLPEDFANNIPPAICKALENWGIPCQALSSQDPLVAAERDYFRQSLIHAGLAKVLWAGLHLTVLHIYIPIASTSHKKLEQQSSAIQLAKVNNSAQGLEQENSLWAEAKGFWYQIS